MTASSGKPLPHQGSENRLLERAPFLFVDNFIMTTYMYTMEQFMHKQWCKVWKLMLANLPIDFNYFNWALSWLKKLINQTNRKQFLPIEHKKKLNQPNQLKSVDPNRTWPNYYSVADELWEQSVTCMHLTGNVGNFLFRMDTSQVILLGFVAFWLGLKG